MKNLLFLSLLMLATLSVQAQNRSSSDIQTLIGKRGNTHHGFYFAPVMKVSNFDGETAFLPGFKGAWTINRTISLGIEGYGLAPTITRDDIDPLERVRPLAGYGGFFVETILHSNRLIHLTVPVMFGAGWVGYVEDWASDGNRNGFSDDLIDDQIIWVAEPGVSAELNIATFFRVNAGVSYRFTQDLDLLNTSAGAFRGVNYSLTLKFGRF